MRERDVSRASEREGVCERKRESVCVSGASKREKVCVSGAREREREGCECKRERERGVSGTSK